MSGFGRILRELRTGRGLSQSALASQIGVSKSSVNMYERGEREPSFETLEAIADVFNVDTDLLLGRKTLHELQLWELSAYTFLNDVIYSYFSQLNSLLGAHRKIDRDIVYDYDKQNEILMDVEKYLRYLRENPSDPNIDIVAKYNKIHKEYEAALRAYRKIIDKHKEKSPKEV